MSKRQFLFARVSLTYWISYIRQALSKLYAFLNFQIPGAIERGIPDLECTNHGHHELLRIWMKKLLENMNHEYITSKFHEIIVPEKRGFTD